MIGIDINGEMLSIARKRCADVTSVVSFMESPACPLEIPTGAVDVVVCQQGFQFFPDRGAAAGEMSRILRQGGRVVVATWRSVEECEFFGAICTALETLGESR